MRAGRWRNDFAASVAGVTFPAMGKFSIVLIIFSALALVAGWLAGGRPAEKTEPRPVDETRTVLTALDAGSRPSGVAAGLWGRLDAMEYVGEFSEIGALE